MSAITELVRELGGLRELPAGGNSAVVLRAVTSTGEMECRRVRGRIPLRIVGRGTLSVRANGRFPFRGTLTNGSVSFVYRIGGTSPSGKVVTRSFPCIRVTGSCRGTNTDTVSILARPG